MPILEKIVISDFRNIQLQELEFSPNVNCISGNNGEGKTNLLDAIYNGEEITSATVSYPLATPIETPLSETEIAAYRALHSNYPNTTVLNDAGAHMVVKYAADTKLYIDNKITALLGEA